MTETEIYLDTLPYDTISIDLSNRNLTDLPDLSRFTNLRVLNCSKNKLTSLPELNNNLHVLNCSCNKLKSLPELKNNLHVLNCSCNKLTSLPLLNDNLQELNCSNNELTILPVLNNNLQKIFCSFNQLTKLPLLNNNLLILYCSCNELTNLPVLNNNLTQLHCSYNNIEYLMFNETFDNIKIKNEKIHNFIQLYYCLKFKNKFRNWLWLKVREPLMQIKYSPEKLVNLLNTMQNKDNEHEFDSLLNNW